ncbi:MAG: ABC transporter substrate-binding protein [Actinomycetota bacterium]|nr:ABC transporter substrate-binding protein [Actinomycetota bacterium]
MALTGCGSTVPLSSLAGSGPGGISRPDQSVTVVGPGSYNGAATEPGAAVNALPSGGSVGSTGATQTPSTFGTTGQGQVSASGGGLPSSGFGWDAKNVYIGVPTADDFNQVTKQAGANFNNGDVHGDMNAIAADINRVGGVLGRKVVVVYHDASTVDYSSNPSVVAQSMCTYFTQDRPVVAVVNGSPQLDAQSNFHGCLEQRKVTLLSLTDTVYSNQDYLRLGPHLFSGTSLSTDILIPAMVSALKRQNFFSGWDTTLGAPSSAPAKVGLLLPDDAPGHYVGGLLKAELKRVGAQVATEYYYPPAGSGNDSQSEVLAFTSAKVTHVLDLPPVELEVALFQRQAENQHYRPRYGLTSFDLPLTVEENSAVAPPAQQIGSVGIGWQPLSDTSAGKDAGDMPGGKRCFDALKAGGQTFNSSSRRAAFAGALSCDALYLLRDAMVAAKGLTGPDLLKAMRVAGPKFAPAATFGSVLSDQNHGVPGYYRDLQYQSACSCFSYQGANRPFSG